MERGVVVGRADGYRLSAKNDGREYWPAVRACIAENIARDDLIRDREAKREIRVSRDGVDLTLAPLMFNNPKRMVFRMDWEGRRYILKWARMGALGLDRLFPRTPGWTYFTRIMVLVNRAVRSGCDATQDYFLVAEKPAGRWRREAWVLLGYLEGESLGDMPENSLRPELRRTVEELLSHGLTMDDLTLHNFLVDGDRVRAIDISCRPFTRLQAVKMAMKMNARYGLGVPLRGFGDRLIRCLLAARYRLRRALGGGEMA